MTRCTLILFKMFVAVVAVRTTYCGGTLSFSKKYEKDGELLVAGESFAARASQLDSLSVLSSSKAVRSEMVSSSSSSLEASMRAQALNIFDCSSLDSFLQLVMS